MDKVEIYVSFRIEEKEKEEDTSYAQKFFRRKHWSGLTSVFNKNEKLRHRGQLESKGVFKSGNRFNFSVHDWSHRRNWANAWKRELKLFGKLFKNPQEKYFELFTESSTGGAYKRLVETIQIERFGRRKRYASSEHEEGWVDNYQGWYLVKFDTTSPRKIFQSKEFEEYLKRRHIWMDFSYDWPRVFMFVPKITKESLEQCFRRFAYLCRVENDLNRVLGILKESYFKRKKPWKRLPR